MRDNARLGFGKHTSRRLAELLLALVSVTGTLLVAEVALRWIMPFDAGRSQEFRIPHRVLGWVLQPGASFVGGVWPPHHRVTYNSRGFRDVEHTQPKPERVFRIVVLGDSFMEGFSVALEASFHRRLGALAAELGRTVEVINLGVGGYGTLQEYLVMREVGWLYEPDLVLLAFDQANDLRNNSLELESIVRAGRMKVMSRPFLDPGSPGDWNVSTVDFDGAWSLYTKELEKRRLKQRRLDGRLAVVRLIVGGANLFEDSLEDVLDWIAPKNRQERDRIRRRRALANLGGHFCKEPPEYSLVWETTVRILARLKAECDARNVPLVAFSVPALDEVEVAAAKKASAMVSEPDELCLEQAPAYGRLAGVLEETGIDFVDLLPAFRRAARSEGVELFGWPDTHWNDRGHDLAAACILQALQAAELLPRPTLSAGSTGVPPPTTAY